ncbi:hypothetical protein SAV14893_081570 [Streptomyces avermitilis]|uniref:Uncharacterized protein n=1 Tax=Streptomyces avermitilis TaxID=33903 RepID=A0A4D4MAC7_STRAX|nr:hypothetical protein [Streptomyces avermitilis]GDY68764.1 hypothetical protein SAV14893_081570 [Streptomyces avermitilis]GDY70854.1 hypothetical protein SAV31267_003390 [Streptomyces avermitilis]
MPNHSGSKSAQKPLYYMGDSAQNSRSRNRICSTGWAAENGDASALVDAADTLNCDEFASRRRTTVAACRRRKAV